MTLTAADLSSLADDLSDSREDLLEGLDAMDEAEPGYLEAKAFYDGTAKEYFASQRIARKIGRSGEVFRLNIAKKAVTAVTDRLEIAAVTVPDNDAATARLAEIMADNEMPLEAPIVHEKACEFGDDYVFLSEGDTPGTVSIERSGALTTRIIYDPEHPKKPKYGIKRWMTGRGERRRMRVNLYYPGDPETGELPRLEKWITVAGTKGTDAVQWQPFYDPADGGVWPLDLDRFPIYHFRTARPFGVPVHKGAYGPQAAINKLVATMMSTVDHHGYPTRYMLTDGAAEEGSDDDDDFGDVSDLDGTPENDRSDTSPTSKLKSGPGEAWWLSGVSGTGSYPEADPDVYLKPADFMLRMMATTTDTPLHFYDPGGDQPSGDSRRQAEGTLTKKVDHLQLGIEATWSRLYVDALAMIGITVEKVDIRWVPSQTVDDLEGWQTAKAKIDAGMPVKQALMEAGYEEAAVDGWLTDGSEQDLRRQVEVLAALAAASRDLGTAVGMGVIPAELVQQVMQRLVGEDDPDAPAYTGPPAKVPTNRPPMPAVPTLP